MTVSRKPLLPLRKAFRNYELVPAFSLFSRSFIFDCNVCFWKRAHIDAYQQISLKLFGKQLLFFTSHAAASPI